MHSSIIDAVSVRLWLVATTLIVGGIFFVGGEVSAADNQPIERKIDDELIMGRVKLVGVIADSSSTTAGIAVIKDSQTGKSYAIKVGDSLPGVAHILLSDVQRDVLTFSTPEKKYLVRPTINIESDSKETELASESESEASGTEQSDGPGLFEKWAAGVAERGPELISLEALKTLDQKYKNLGKDEARRKAMNSLNDAIPPAVEELNIIDSTVNESPVNESTVVEEDLDDVD